MEYIIKGLHDRCIFLSFALLFLSNAVPSAFAADPVWNYSTSGPTTWLTSYATCAGTMQSPLNLDPFKSRVAQPGFLKFWAPQTLSTSIPLKSDGSGFRFDMTARNVQLISSSFINNMLLRDVSFRTPSEHTINGVVYPLEVQYTFVPQDYAARDAQTLAYDIVVVSIMHTSSATDPSPHVISQAAANVAQVVVPGTTVVQYWVPKFDFPDTYYMYRGSLTYPPCTQNVHWFVSADVLPAKSSDVDAIASAIRQITGSATGNARPVQSLNARDIKLRSFQSSE